LEKNEQTNMRLKMDSAYWVVEVRYV
jgi:hypothetical protein